MVERLPPSYRGLRRAAELIREGGVIVYPTDTVYGIGCDAFNEGAVERVFEIKRREQKPMPVLCSCLDDVARVGVVDEGLYRLAIAFWPGAVSIVVGKSPELPSRVTAGLDKVAIRIPAHIVPLELIRLSGSPIVGTSANISGQPPAVSHEDLAREILEEVDAVIEGGLSHAGVASTVLELVGGGRVRVVRRGALGDEELAKRLKLAGFTKA